MADPLEPRRVDLCLVADAVLAHIKADKPVSQTGFSNEEINEAWKFLVHLGYSDVLSKAVSDAYQRKNLKGGTE